MFRVKVNVVLVLLQLFGAFSTSAQESESNDFQIKQRAELYKRENPYIEIPGYYAKFDLGEIELGKSGIVSLELVNPFEEDIHFEKISIGCDCVTLIDADQFEKAGALGSKKSIKIKFKLTVQDQSPKPDVQLAINFKSAKKAGGESRGDLYNIRATVSYQIKGMIAFRGKLCTLEIPSNAPLGELRMGFVYTAPVAPRNLEVLSSEALKDIDFQLTSEREGEGILIGKVKVDAVNEGPIGGEVVVRDRVTGRKASFWLTALKVESLKLSPLFLTFRKNDENEDYRATAILKIMKDFETAEARTVETLQDSGNYSESPSLPKKSIQESDLQISCLYRDKSIVVDKKRLGNQTFRIDLRVSAKEIRDLERSSAEKKDDSSKQSVVIKIRFNDQDYTIERETHFHIDK